MDELVQILKRLHGIPTWYLLTESAMLYLLRSTRQSGNLITRHVYMFNTPLFIDNSMITHLATCP